jgi:hypothetical protein
MQFNIRSPSSYLKIFRLADTFISVLARNTNAHMGQLDVTCFIISLFTAQRVSKVSASIFRSLRLICWVISWAVLLWFDVCWCYSVVRLGWCVILMQAEAPKCFSLHKDTTPPQPNHTVTPTHIEPEQHNPWNKATNKSQVPEDGCTNIRNMLNIK